MNHLDAKALFVLILASLLAWAGAHLVARRYRARMVALMRDTGAAVEDTAAEAEGAPGGAMAPTASPAAVNPRLQHLRLLGLLLGLCLLIALSQAAIDGLLLTDGPPSLRRVLLLGLVYAWPAVPVLAVLHRWRPRHLLAGLVLWLALAWAVTMLNSTADQSGIAVLGWLAAELSFSVPVMLMLTLGSTARAIAPWIWMPLAILCALSTLSLDLLSLGLARDAAWVHWLAANLGATAGISLIALLPWLIALPLMKFYGRVLAHAYTAKWLSELMTLFTAIWGVSLGIATMVRGSGGDPRALALLLPLAWIPLVLLLAGRSRHPPRGRAPTLLVLRVFQRDAAVQDLFDRVLERWRTVGNTVLIAGTDLADRTMDAADIFTFIDGRLASRFIRSAEDLARHVAAFDFEPDAEGRYRVNECYCADRTWQLALARLVQISDVVLMDLRGFQARNAGCRHELQVLAGAPTLSRVLVLIDSQTDVALARELTAQAAPGRFDWLGTESGRGLPSRDIVRALLPLPSPAAGVPT